MSDSLDPQNAPQPQEPSPTEVAPTASEAPSEPQGEPAEPSMVKRALSFVGELLHVVIISLAIIIPVRYFLIQPFYVKGASMEPNFNDHEYLIIDEIGYRFNEIQRGEIVVFRYPQDPSQYFIKRVIGLPGERVKVHEGKVWIYNNKYPDGKVADETMYLGPLQTSGSADVTLAEGQYFLMGDNRGASLDSRAFGAVPREFVVGRVWLRGWPPEKMQAFSNPPNILESN